MDDTSIPIDAEFYAGLESDVKSFEFLEKRLVLITLLFDICPKISIQYMILFKKNGL